VSGGLGNHVNGYRVLTLTSWGRRYRVQGREVGHGHGAARLQWDDEKRVHEAKCKSKKGLLVFETLTLMLAGDRQREGC
jgi:hypothetical protein